MATIAADHGTREPTVARKGPASLRSSLRHHGLFLVLFGAGAALRVLAMLAYRPALVFNDSAYYLDNYDLGWQPGTTKPVGYVVLLLRPVLAFGDLRTVVTVQHLLGLATAVVVYVVLLRCGARRWLAAVAATPILLDAYIVQVEHVIMPEALFHALLVGALGLLIWRRPPPLVAAAIGGLLLAAAVTVRNVGQVLGIPAVIYMLLVGGRPLRRALGAAVMTATFVAPLIAYGLWFQHFHGEFRLTNQAAPLLYGRVAPFVECSNMDLPEYQVALCPTLPPQDRPGPGMYVHASTSPIAGYQPPAGMDRGQAINDFAVRAIRHQPLDYLRAVASDFAWGFIWTKANKPGNPAPVERWQFQVGFPTFFDDTPGFLRQYGNEGPSVNRGLARFLRTYQLTVGYTRGTVVLGALIVGLLGAIGVGRARRSGLQAACLMWTLVPVGLLLVPAAMFEFTWRYQLPGIVLLPVAGALGLTAMTGARTDR
jgi:hypothetical protein